MSAAPAAAAESPRVSVVMPTFNSAAWLARALDSILAQDYPAERVQIVVVDDDSRDRSVPIAASYARRHPDMQVLRQAENAGPAAARNRGLRVCRGELIAFLDSDDTWAPDKLSRQVAAYRADPELGLIHCGARFVDEDGEEIAGWSRRSRPAQGDILLEFVCDFFLITSAVMVPRRCLDAVGHFDPSLRVGEDNELFLRLLARYRAGCLDAPLLNRTVRADSLSRQDFALDARNDLLILDRFLQAHPQFAARHRDRIARRYASYLYDYGYRLLENGQRRSARAALAQSLLRRPSLAGIKAMVRSLLPAAAHQLLRRA